MNKEGLPQQLLAWLSSYREIQQSKFTLSRHAINLLDAVRISGKLIIFHSLHHTLQRFDGAGYSLLQTKEVLSSLASDSMVEGGEYLNAVEVFWSPSEPNEVLTRNDIILDFPELIDL
jgi:uncharacterized membrane protein